MLQMDVKDFAYKIKRFFPKYIPKPKSNPDDCVGELYSKLGFKPFITTSDVEKRRGELRDYKFI